MMMVMIYIVCEFELHKQLMILGDSPFLANVIIRPRRSQVVDILLHTVIYKDIDLMRTIWLDDCIDKKTSGQQAPLTFYAIQT